VLDANGNINLNNMAFDNNNYKRNGIELPLTSLKTPKRQAVTINKISGGGRSAISPSLNSIGYQQLVLVDADDDGANYSYCSNVQAMSNSSGGPTAPLDPLIVNRAD
jgi:hypothetical protein